MTILQKRRLTFWLVLFALCLVPFVVLPWYGALVLLFLFLLAFGRSLESYYKQIVCQPVPSPSPSPSPSPEEYSSYTQGYQPEEVTYYTPPSSPVMPKEEPFTDEVPVAQYQYPEQRQYETH